MIRYRSPLCHEECLIFLGTVVGVFLFPLPFRGLCENKIMTQFLVLDKSLLYFSAVLSQWVHFIILPVANPSRRVSAVTLDGFSRRVRGVWWRAWTSYFLSLYAP